MESPFHRPRTDRKDWSGRSLSWIVVLLLLAACGPGAAAAKWPASTPEQQGIDSQAIAEMLDTILKDGAPIHGLLILRNGALVTEAYISPFHRDDRHIIYSATKSMTTLLTGIAIRDGLIGSDTTPVLTLLPDARSKLVDTDARKEAIQVRHLLTMMDGIKWQDEPYGIREPGDFSRLLASDDGVLYALSRPMAAEPGTQYNYNSGSSFLLAAILQKVSGMTALQYANKTLFFPLGIRDAAWARYGGINNGGSEMFLRPADMARIGQMMLDHGRWNGRQVIPAEWVDKSFQSVITSEPKLNEQYGYGWYTKELGGHIVHSAEGLGGNFLFVIPDLRMVVLFTGGLTERAMIKPYLYLSKNILPAVRSEAALPANPQATLLLDRVRKRLQDPPPGKWTPAPAAARAASGQLYEVADPENLLGIRQFRFSLKGTDQARLDFKYSGTGKNADWGVDLVFRTDNLVKDEKTIRLDVGLDGRFRTVMVNHEEIGRIPLSARAHWEDERTLVLEVVTAWAVPEKWTLTFPDADTALLSVETLFYTTTVTGKANGHN